MILFIDTETTGLPKDWKAPVTMLNNWPRLIQIAWKIYDFKGNLQKSEVYTIEPDGFIIPFDSVKLHKITNTSAKLEGRYIKGVLIDLVERLKDVKVIVSHNIDFDTKVIGAEFLRYKIDSNFMLINTFCTMEELTDYCEIPSEYGFKFPSLTELYFKIFKETYKETHDAKLDVDICAKCFWELYRRLIVNVQDYNYDKQNNVSTFSNTIVDFYKLYQKPKITDQEYNTENKEKCDFLFDFNTNRYLKRIKDFESDLFDYIEFELENNFFSIEQLLLNIYFTNKYKYNQVELLTRIALIPKTIIVRSSFDKSFRETLRLNNVSIDYLHELNDNVFINCNSVLDFITFNENKFSSISVHEKVVRKQPLTNEEIENSINELKVDRDIVNQLDNLNLLDFNNQS